MKYDILNNLSIHSKISLPSPFKIYKYGPVYISN